MNTTLAQDMDYTHRVIKSLTKDEMHGRGYVSYGDRLAANYISSQFELNGLKKFGENYFQFFHFSVNTFPSTVILEVNGVALAPGVDYLVHPASDGAKCTAEIITVKKPPAENVRGKHKGKWVVVDKSEIELPEDKRKMDSWLSNPGNAVGVIMLEEKKLTWHVSRDVKKYPILIVLDESWPDHVNEVKVNLKNKFINKHHVPNVIAYVQGSKYPDKYITYSAHYDHLGRMGTNTIFPGANDNASGVSMLLNLAKYFGDPQNQPEYSVIFIAFAGEEAGLVGSAYYTQYPVVSLDKISFLINLDLMGTGDDGMMVVNGKVFEKEYDQLVKINNSKNYLTEIKSRGKAANSDHYYFSEKGVRAFFFYTLGGIKAYHDIYDVAETLPLTEYSDIYKLLLDFHQWLEKDQ